MIEAVATILIVLLFLFLGFWIRNLIRRLAFEESKKIDTIRVLSELEEHISDLSKFQHWAAEPSFHSFAVHIAQVIKYLQSVRNSTFDIVDEQNGKNSSEAPERKE